MKKNIGKRILSLAMALVMVVELLPMTSMTAHAATAATYTDGVYVLEVTNYDEYMQTGEHVHSIELLSIENVDISINTSNQIVCSFKLRFIDAIGQERTTDYSFSFTVENKSCTEAISHSFEATYGKGSSTTYVVTKGTLTRAARTEHTGGTATCVAKAKCSVCGEEYGDYGDHSWGDWTYSIGTHRRTCTLNSDHTEYGVCYPGDDGKCTVCKTTLVASRSSGGATYYYATADDAFTAAQNAGNGTVTILADAEITKNWYLYSYSGISLVVNENVTLTLTGSSCLYLNGSISGGGRIAATGDQYLAVYSSGSVSNVEIACRAGCQGTIYSGTFTYQTSAFSNNGTIKDGTFDCDVENAESIEGGTFNGAVTNKYNGEISGGTFNASLVNEYNTRTFTGGTINADNLTLGENFSFTEKSGSYAGITCTTHQRRLDATCKEGKKCIFCGNVEGDPVPNAHSLSYTAADNVITETCAYNCTDPATATLEINTGSVTYNGAAQTIEASVTHSATWRGERLTAQYKNNTDVGTATVYIQAGEAKAEKTFEITRATPTLEHFDITLPQNAVYDGSEKAATVTLASPYSKCGEITVEYYNGETKLDGAPTDAGTYTVKFRVAEGDNFNAMDLTEAGSFTITKADPICTAPTAIAGLVYNGKEKTLIYSAESLDGTVYYSLDGSNYTESLPKGTNAQEYTVYYKVVGDANHNDMEPKTVTATIAPFNIGTASCKAGVWGGPFTYNGQEHTPTPQIDVSIPSGEANVPSTEVRLDKDIDYTVAYSNNVNAGEAVVTFTGKGNYTGTITRKFTITPKPITVTIADKTSVYGEAVATLTATDDGIVNNDTNVYALATDASSTANAGTYPITGTALDDNYAITFVNGTYTVTKAPVNSIGTDMAVDYTAGMEVDLRQMFSVDENAGEVDYWITYLTGDGSFTGAPYLYRIDKAGTFTVKITTKETANYKSGEATAVLTVKAGDPGIGDVTAGVVNDTLETSAIVLTRANTDIPGTLTVDAGQTLTLGDNTIRYTFTPNDTTNYQVVTGEVAVTVVDTIAPTGTVSIDDNQWNDLWNTITFGLFFKETKTVKVAAEDVLSGIAKVEYYDSATALSADAVKAITAWTDMGADYAQDVTAEDAKTFIYYIRITDKAGNVTYISTADATYDLTKPVISGITNGSTYYTTQKVTVTDTNLDSVTLNGDAVTGEITLAGNVDKTYTIVATDKAGNETTCTVTMKAIASISAPIDSIGENNVNSGNTDAIVEVEATAAALDTTNATDAEKAAIKAITDKCDALQEVIADTAAEYERITDAIAAYDPDEVTSADKAALDKLAEDLEALAESGNLTDSEKTALETPTENLDAMIETVNEVTEEFDRIADAVGDYDQETVKSSDKEEIEQLAEDIDALLDTDNLTDEERTALEGEKTKCENLLAKIEGTDALVDKLTEDVGSYDEDTVKSTDKAALEQLVEDIEAVIEGNTNITEEEKTELEALVDTVEDLLTKIEEVAQAPVTEDTEKVEDITSENVTPEDKEDLTNAKADLEDALTENAGNYTEDEKKAIQDEIDRIDDALEAIENVEAAEETVSKLPAVDKVEPDDEDAIKAITDAKAEYDALTDHEKSLVDEDTKKKLDDLCAALVAYDIIKGENGKYTQGSSKGLSFTANGAYSKFTGILVDNKVVDSKHYTAESGSTVITLKASYLDTLSTGKHTLTVVYTDGETSCEFNIAAKSATPATGDNFNILLWTSVMIISLAAITVLLIEQKKRRYVK